MYDLATTTTVLCLIVSPFILMGYARFHVEHKIKTLGNKEAKPCTAP